jgi:hypothetical protein
MSDGQSSAPANQTQAHVTGKVPQVFRKPAGRNRKARKMSAQGRHHANQLKKGGLISPGAAARNGI